MKPNKEQCKFFSPSDKYKKCGIEASEHYPNKPEELPEMFLKSESTSAFNNTKMIADASPNPIESTPYEELSHYHCFDPDQNRADKDDHKNHLRCCLCSKDNPKRESTPEPKPEIEQIAEAIRKGEARFDKLESTPDKWVGRLKKIYDGSGFMEEIEIKTNSLIKELLNSERERLISVIEGMNVKAHICRFNDDEQSCECYVEAKEDILNILKIK